MTIGLVMIMKNEESVILRCLNNVYPIIGHFIIVDTGSTDKSKEIVQKFFQEKNINGEIHDYPFVNFEDARNFALEKAKGKSDFCFTLDADEVLTLPSIFNINNLKSQLIKIDIGLIDIHYGGTIYSRRAFWRNSKPFRYFGAVHEILLCDDETTESNIKGLHVKVSADGNSWQQDLKHKYLGHAKLIHEYIEKNGEEPRHTFYLAQSYKDAGETEKAIEWYRKRVNITTGYYEERYWSQLMIARLKWDLKLPVMEIADEFMKCFEYDDLRAEHMQEFKHMYELNGRPKSALKIGELLNKYIGKNPYPKRGLFINPEAYKEYVAPPKKTLDDLFDSIPSAWIEHREFSYWLINEIKPKVTVDLGVDWGYSTFALAIPNIGKVYGIDYFEGDPLTGIRNTYNEVINNVKWLRDKHKISNIEIIKGRFEDVAKRWKQKIDILHIDEVPTDIKKDYDTWSRFVGDNGVILFHNTQAFKEVKEFFNALDLPKYEFEHSGGLGIVSKNRDIINRIYKKYSPIPVIPMKPEKITIAYIAHDADVFNKYLHPSLKNLRGDFETMCLSSIDNMPAVNYNHMLKMSNTKYVLFVHEDTTFSPDFLEKIYVTINKYPNFGAIGAVGNYKNNIQWSKENEIIEVKTVDCCCILVNKENDIKFDSKTFDEYHLYVDDYCLQVGNKGLKCYTIPINAFEANKDDVYSIEGSYFRHHSQTVRIRGYAWGKYWEYLKKMEDKWKIKPIGVEFNDNNLNAPTSVHENIGTKYEVDVCIISYAQTDELKKVTEKGIKTLLKSEENITFNIFVVESNRLVKYDFPNTQTIYPSIPFSYNAYLNLGVSVGKAPYIFLANSDLSYEKYWASNIIKEMEKNPSILSASPFCPQTQSKSDFPDNIYAGYQVRRELAGWAIFQQRKIYDYIGELNCDVSFWFSDNIYSDQLMFHKILHVLVTNSIVNHHEYNLGVTGSSILDENKKNEFTTGQHTKYLKAKEKLFNSNKTLDFYA